MPLTLSTLLASALAASLTLAVGETRPVDGLAARVTFVGVTSDSRCPTGTTCVWEGDAAVDVRLQPNDGPAHLVRLHTSGREPREAVAAGLRLVLDRLDPYPDATAPIAPDEYRLVLSITAQ